MPEDYAVSHAAQIGALAATLPNFDKYGSTSSALLVQAADYPDVSIIGVLGAIVEALEVTQQGRDAIFAQIARKMYNLGAEIDPRIEKAIADFQRSMTENSYANRPELRHHVERYRAEFKNGRRVVLVPHSQGNFFANEGYDKLFVDLGSSSPLKRSIGQIGLANPTGFMSDDRGLFVKFANDWIRCLPPTSSPPNLPNADTPPTVLWMDLCLLTTGSNNASDRAHWPDTYLFKEASSQNLLKQHLARIGQELEYPISVVDISTQQTVAEATSDLIDDTNNLDIEIIEAGRPLYLEGMGLSSALFVVPGVTEKLRATVVNLATDHPLYVSGAEVWRIDIPSTAQDGATGRIKVIFSVNGVEQTYETPREVRITLPVAEWIIRRKANAFSQIAQPQYAGVAHVCPEARPTTVGFVGTVLESVGSDNREVAHFVGDEPAWSNGFNDRDSSVCYTYPKSSSWTDARISATVVGEASWEYHLSYDYVAATGNGDEVATYTNGYVERWDLAGSLAQRKRADGQCDFIRSEQKCVTQTYTDGITGRSDGGTNCNTPQVAKVTVGACVARPGSAQYKWLWATETANYLMQPHYSGLPVLVTPTYQVPVN